MAFFLSMPGAEALGTELAQLTGGVSEPVETRRFPDGETYVRVPPNLSGQDVFVTCRLSPPDLQFLALVFAARAARSSGAKTLKLIAPYLPYLRQDRIFRDGEALSSTIFADLVSREFDGLVTVDPHLHRYSSLAEIYTIPTMVLSAAKLIGQWVRDHVESPIVLGPDAESEQWAKAIADAAGAPWATFSKVREGDRQVRLRAPDLQPWRGRQPVLVDDIISSGTTMLEAARYLIGEGFRAPHCAVVHGLFDPDTAERLKEFSSGLVTTDTIPNAYSDIAIAPLIAAELPCDSLIRGLDDPAPAKGNS